MVRVGGGWVVEFKDVFRVIPVKDVIKPNNPKTFYRSCDFPVLLICADVSVRFFFFVEGKTGRGDEDV